MEIIENSDNDSLYLFQDGAVFYLMILSLCGHSDKELMIQLSEEEISLYQTQGCPYIDAFADTIRFIGLCSINSKSIFLERKVSFDLSRKAWLEINAWRAIKIDGIQTVNTMTFQNGTIHYVFSMAKENLTSAVSNLLECWNRWNYFKGL